MNATAKSTEETRKARAEKHRRAMAERSRLDTASVSDIGDIPKVRNAKRRKTCRLDLRRFLELYFPFSTGLSPFSADHARMIARIQLCILEGGRFVNAVYRGAAKTTIAENAAIWATVYGHRRFVPLFGADSGAAEGSLDSIKMELSENDLLYDDFPEVCHPVRHLEGKAQRAASQTYRGEFTYIEWTAELVRFATIPKAPGSGAIIATRGITSGFRGLKLKLPDGTNQRPDCVLLDDVQTDDSAGSPLQVGKTLRTIRKAIGRLGGHRRGLAMVCNATVIERDDAIDRLLADPAWQGERIPMVKTMPAAFSTLWLEQYAEIRRSYNREDVSDQKRAWREATEFYRANREAMDAGAEVSWASCFDPDEELSALQHAMNIRIDDGEEAFQSECQQQPLRRQEESPDRLSVDQICKQQGATAHGIAPYNTAHVTAFVDVHDELLVWCVCAWAADFTGQVISYGAFPEQRTRHWQLRKADPALQTQLRASSADAAIVAGLERLIGSICNRAWPRDGGGEVKVSRLLVDRGYKPSLVHQAVKKLGLGDIVLPSNGFAVGAKNLPLEDRTSELSTAIQKDITGGWLIKRDSQRGFDKYARYETFRWKSFVYDRLACGFGETGALVLYKADPAEHRLFAEHLTAETTKPQIDERSGRRVVEWHMKENRADNHWFDCLVGCTVGAAMLGAVLEGMRVKTAEPIRTGRADADAKRREFIARRGY